MTQSRKAHYVIIFCLLTQAITAMDHGELRQRRGLPGTADVPTLTGDQLADEVGRIRADALAQRPWINRHPYLLASCAGCLSTLIFPLVMWLTQDAPQRPTPFPSGANIPGGYLRSGGQA